MSNTKETNTNKYYVDVYCYKNDIKYLFTTNHPLNT